MQQSQIQHQVTIAVTRYAEADRIIIQSLRHALVQRGVGGEVLFIEQQESAGLRADDFLQQELSLRIIRGKLAGLSEARNLALREARNPFVLFLDADALPEPGWALEIARLLSGHEYAIAGSRIIPRWPGHAPAFTRANVLREQYSLLDLGGATRPASRVVGAGFGVDREKLPDGFCFDTTLGRRRGMLFGGEDSDFCNRARILGLGVAYVGTATVTHLIEPERCRWSWILKRMIFAGHGRARIGGVPSASAPTNFYDWIYLPAYLPPYALGWLWGKITSIRSR